jgi:hypothetical protein
MLCLCGCKEEVKKGNKFISGHNSRVMTEEIKNKISKTKKGCIVSLEARKNMSNSLKGKPAWNKGLTKETDGRVKNHSLSMMGKGRPHTEESKEKLREINMGHLVSEETRNKLSNMNKGKFTREKHPNWLGGISFLPYSLEWTEELKTYIHNRDNNECQNPNCEHNSTILDTHHIDYDKQNCSQFNLITLCRSCHMITNFNRNLWKRFYNKIVWSKYL